MNAAVIVSSFVDFYATPHRMSAMGARIVKQLLDKEGIATTFFNFCNLAKPAYSVELDNDLNYLFPFIYKNETGPLSFFTTPQRFGPKPEEMAQEIILNNPDYCFFSVFAYCYAQLALSTAAHIKKVLPHTKIIFGGHGPSSAPQTFLNNTAIDFVLSGEAELSIPAFVKECREVTPNFSNVPNCFFKKDAHIVVPRCALHTNTQEICVVAAPSSVTKKLHYYSLALSRGCPKQCSFCTNSLCHGTTFRTASIASVSQAIDTIKLAPAATLRLNIEDDNILADVAFLFEVLEMVFLKFGKFLLFFENGLDYTLLSDDVLFRLKHYGLAQINLSLAIYNLNMSNHQHRPLKMSQFTRVLFTCQKLSVPAISYYICGLPNDTARNAVETIVFLMQHPTRIGISLFYPSPSDAHNKKHPSFIRACGSSAYPWSGSLTTEELITAFRLSRLANALTSKTLPQCDQALIQQCIREKKLFTRIGAKDNVGEGSVCRQDESMVALFFGLIDGATFNPL